MDIAEIRKKAKKLREKGTAPGGFPEARSGDSVASGRNVDQVPSPALEEVEAAMGGGGEVVAADEQGDGKEGVDFLREALNEAGAESAMPTETGPDGEVVLGAWGISVDGQTRGDEKPEPEKAKPEPENEDTLNKDAEQPREDDAEAAAEVAEEEPAPDTRAEEGVESVEGADLESSKKEAVEKEAAEPEGMGAEKRALSDDDDFILDDLEDEEEGILADLPADLSPELPAPVDGSAPDLSTDLSTEVSFDTIEDVDEGEEDEDTEIEAITFLLDSEEYALDIVRVKEVIKNRESTDVPRSSDVMLGVISLRGTIVPIMDLRGRLGLPPAAERQQRIVIVKDGDDLMGLVVDSVKRVVRVMESALEAPPQIKTVDGKLISALGRSDGEPFILLELDRVVEKI